MRGRERQRGEHGVLLVCHPGWARVGRGSDRVPEDQLARESYGRVPSYPEEGWRRGARIGLYGFLCSTGGWFRRGWWWRAGCRSEKGASFAPAVAAGQDGTEGAVGKVPEAYGAVVAGGGEQRAIGGYLRSYSIPPDPSVASRVLSGENAQTATRPGSARCILTTLSTLAGL